MSPYFNEVSNPEIKSRRYSNRGTPLRNFLPVMNAILLINVAALIIRLHIKRTAYAVRSIFNSSTDVSQLGRHIEVQFHYLIQNTV